jgi:hypothetical protein
MTPARAAWPADGALLLEPSVSYALGVALAVTPELLSSQTPCREWDLRMLLRHACESLAAFGEGIEAGRVGLDPAAEDGDLAADPARAFRDRAGQLLDAWTGRHPLFGRQSPWRLRTAPVTGSPPSSGVLRRRAVHIIADEQRDLLELGRRQGAGDAVTGPCSRTGESGRWPKWRSRW